MHLPKGFLRENVTRNHNWNACRRRCLLQDWLCYLRGILLGKRVIVCKQQQKFPTCRSMDNWKETSLLHRTLRTTFILTLLIGLTILVSISPISAASHSAHAANAASTGRSFQANGHSQVVGQRLNTATTPYVKGTGPGVLPARPAPGGIAHVPSPTNVAKAPIPTPLRIWSSR